MRAPTSTGARGPDGRVIDGAPNLSPVDPSSGILPSDMQDYVGAGTRVSQDQIDEQRPKDNHELLTKVPGVMVVGDDGAARHSNIGVRGRLFGGSTALCRFDIIPGKPLKLSPYKFVRHFPCSRRGVRTLRTANRGYSWGGGGNWRYISRLHANL